MLINNQYTISNDLLSALKYQIYTGENSIQIPELSDSRSNGTDILEINY